tara:strand:+ start:1098 stop:1274 length:177 start_codon:yes stop_codon:yes gene_type:complete
MNSIRQIRKSYPKEYTEFFNTNIRDAMEEAMKITNMNTTEAQYKRLVLFILNIKMLKK